MSNPTPFLGLGTRQSPLQATGKNIFDHLPLPVVVSAPNMEILDANLPAIELLGLRMRSGVTAGFEPPTRDLVGLNGEVLLESDHPAALAGRENISVINEQIGVVAEDGSIAWFSVSAMPVACIGVITTYYDIGRGYAIEQELRHHLDQLDAFFETNLDLLAILNSDCRAVRLNPAWQRMLGYSVQEINGACLLDFVHPNDLELTLGAFARARAQNEVVWFVNRLRCFDGQHRILEWRVTTRGMLVYATARDITEQRAAEVALQNSEARFRVIFEQAAVGVAEIEADTGNLLRVNQRLCDIVGYTEQELLGRNFQSLNHQEDLPMDLAALRELNQDGLTNYHRDKRYLRKDGSIVWINLQIRRLGEPVDGIRRLVAVMEDITEQYVTNAMLRKSLAETLAANQRFRFQVSNMPLAFITWNTDLEVEEWNAAAEGIFGWAAKEAEGKAISKLILPAATDVDGEQMWRAVRDRDLLQVRPVMDFRTRDGSRRTCEWFNAPLIDPTGKMVGGMSMFNDITERLQVDERILRSQHMESLGSFAGGIAYDVGGALRSILHVARLIQSSPGDTSLAEQGVATIIKTCGQGRRLVRGLLDFAQQNLSVTTNFGVSEVLEEQLSLLGKSLIDSINVIREYQNGVPSIKGDRIVLGSALMHLFINAIDAMPDGGNLTLRCHARDSKFVVVEVEDNGMGMPKEVLEHALEPFFSTKASGKGVGLGLPAVYGAVKAHQGELEVMSNSGRGTLVRMTLPLRPTENVTLRETGERPMVSMGLRILLVDDDELVQAAVTHQLRRLGHAVTTSNHGQDALEKLASGLEVDLVLLDINMPVLDGYSAMPQLRALRPNLPVIIQTGNLDQWAKRSFHDYRNVSFLVRPFSLNELRMALAPWADRMSGR